MLRRRGNRVSSRFVDARPARRTFSPASPPRPFALVFLSCRTLSSSLLLFRYFHFTTVFSFFLFPFRSFFVLFYLCLYYDFVETEPRPLEPSYSERIRDASLHALYFGCWREPDADGVLVRVGQLCDIVAWEREEVGVSVALRCVGRVEITGAKRQEDGSLEG